jgi:hypothetical protein
MLKKKIIAEQFHGAKGTPKKKKKVIQSDEKSAVLESKDEFVDKKDWFLSPQEEMTFKTRYALSPTEESHLSKVTFSTSLQKYLKCVIFHISQEEWNLSIHSFQFVVCKQLPLQLMRSPTHDLHFF